MIGVYYMMSALGAEQVNRIKSSIRSRFLRHRRIAYRRLASYKLLWTIGNWRGKLIRMA